MNSEPKRWEQQLRDAAAHAEEDLRKVVTYLNDEVVPDIRRNSSEALRAAATELQKLAQRLEAQQAARNAASPPPKPKP